ncbi:MAG: N-6 DNA methylase [Bacteroidetes bacterium]|nr:N-6 DNA methylase [Bacteroidota bacterium]
MIREIQVEGVNPIESITDKMWSVFDILRNEPITPEDYHLVLFLLSIYKDGYFDGNIFLTRIKIRNIENRLHDYTAKNYAQYAEIYEAFEPSLHRLSENGLQAIIQLLLSIDITSLKSNFSDIFDNILYRIAKSQSRFGGEFLQPSELTRFICCLADLSERSTIFNPFAGVASFGVFLEKGQFYFGQEINFKTWAIGTLRILAYNRSNSCQFVKDDSILNWPDNNQKFDFILSNPPYGLRLSNNYRDMFPDYTTAEQFLIEKGISSLSSEGKLIAVLPNGFLFKSGREQQLRVHLVEADLIEAIISLPGGYVLNTGVPLIILLLNKAKANPGLVKFIDARKFFDSKGAGEMILDYRALYSEVKSELESDSLRMVTTRKIRDFEFNLNVPRYFQKRFKGVKLSKILEYIRGKRASNIEFGKLIRIRNLKDDKFEYYLDENSVENSELNRPYFRLIDETCLLLSIRWRILKPTIFKFEGTPILLSNDILAFKVNESLVNVSYLINELHSNYVQEQLESYRLGEPIPYIRRNDLLEIKVKLPSLKEQTAKVEGLEELSNNIKSLQQERNALAHGSSSLRFDEFASLKHTLGRPRQNILDWSDNLLHFLGNRTAEFQKLNMAFEKFYEIDIISALNEIKRDVNFMSEILEKGENGLIVNEYPLQLVSLSDINALTNHLTHDRFNFKLTRLPIKGEKLKERGIECNPTLLKTLIDNILTNANKHAFSNKDTANEVLIELIVIEDLLILEIKNNGQPFPKHFDKEKFISKYTTVNPVAGSGLGGYDINRIAEYFNNPGWELILNDDPIYPVKFKFHFQIKLIK